MSDRVLSTRNTQLSGSQALRAKGGGLKAT